MFKLKKTIKCNKTILTKIPTLAFSKQKKKKKIPTLENIFHQSRQTKLKNIYN